MGIGGGSDKGLPRKESGLRSRGPEHADSSEAIRHDPRQVPAPKKEGLRTADLFLNLSLALNRSWTRSTITVCPTNQR